MSLDSGKQLRWKVAFRVQFSTPKFGLKFQPAPQPDTGNGCYNVSLMDVPQVDDPKKRGPAQHYNAILRPEQQHLSLREGLYLTHINEEHLLDIPCQMVISRLKTVPRPVKLRFVDVDAGVVPSTLRHDPPTGILSPTNVAPSNNAEEHITPFTLNGKESTELQKVETPENNSDELRTTSSHVARAPSSLSNTQDVYKIVLLGTTGVGKSSILSVCIDGDEGYVERRNSTLEAEFGSLSVPNPDISNPNQVIKVRIWDTAGQERYRAITRSHYRRADGAILVYDVADPRSFESLDGWLQDLKELAADSIKSIMLLEHKADQLPPREGGEGRPRSFVNEHRVKEYCRANGLLFARTSARMNSNVYKWEGQKISDVVNQLVLNVHATKLARGAADPSGANGFMLGEKADHTPAEAKCAGCG